MPKINIENAIKTGTGVMGYSPSSKLSGGAGAGEGGGREVILSLPLPRPPPAPRELATQARSDNALYLYFSITFQLSTDGSASSFVPANN